MPQLWTLAAVSWWVSHPVIPTNFVRWFRRYLIAVWWQWRRSMANGNWSTLSVCLLHIPRIHVSSGQLCWLIHSVCVLRNICTNIEWFVTKCMNYCRTRYLQYFVKKKNKKPILPKALNYNLCYLKQKTNIRLVQVKSFTKTETI